jgi:AraC-like DNA-binding protein
MAAEVLRLDDVRMSDFPTEIGVGEKITLGAQSAVARNGRVLSRSEFLDTSAAPAAERFTVWRNLLQLTCGPSHVQRGGDEFRHGTMLRSSLGDMQVALVDADPHSFGRTSGQVEQCRNPTLYVCYVCGGSAHVAQDGRDEIVGAGQLFSFDSTRPYKLTMPERFRMVVLRFRHRMVGLTPQNTHPLTARAWSGAADVGAFLSQAMVTLSRHITELSATSAPPLASSFVSLISTLFAERLRESTMDPVVVRQALVMRIKAYATEHLDDPALYSETLAQRHGISLRYLQLLFAEQGTSPARWIRHERLARCYADLLNPQYDHLTVAVIGERWGLPGASHFSRLFRDRYGKTPSEFRKTR